MNTSTFLFVRYKALKKQMLHEKNPPRFAPHAGFNKIVIQFCINNMGYSFLFDTYVIIPYNGGYKQNSEVHKLVTPHPTGIAATNNPDLPISTALFMHLHLISFLSTTDFFYIFH